MCKSAYVYGVRCTWSIIHFNSFVSYSPFVDIILLSCILSELEYGTRKGQLHMCTNSDHFIPNERKYKRSKIMFANHTPFTLPSSILIIFRLSAHLCAYLPCVETEYKKYCKAFVQHLSRRFFITTTQHNTMQMPTSYIPIWGISRFAYKINAILIRFTCAHLRLILSAHNFYFFPLLLSRAQAHRETSCLFFTPWYGEKKNGKNNPPHVICKLNTIQSEPIAQYCCRSVRVFALYACFALNSRRGKRRQIVFHGVSILQSIMWTQQKKRQNIIEKRAAPSVCSRWQVLGCYYTHTSHFHENIKIIY